MRLKYSVLAVACLFLCGSCATVKKPEVESLPETKPQISKTLSQEAPQRYLKRKVAIARFTNETKYGQSFFLDKDQDWIGKQAMDILSARLTATDKFLLLERSDIEKINKELALGNLSSLKIPADYLIVGSVSEFGRKVTGDVGFFSRTKKQTAYAKVNIRLIDVYSSHVIYSEEGAGEAFSEAGEVFGVGGRAGYDSTLNDKAISAAISKLVSNIVENLLEKPWRSYLLSYESGLYIIAGGKSQGIKEGDLFGVFQRGKQVLNPQTNIMIELPSKLIGTIRVDSSIGTEPMNEVSLCSVVNGDLPKEDYEGYFVQEIKQ